MTLEGLKTLLTGIAGFADKVAFDAWPENEAPALPYICFTTPDTSVFYADGIAFYAADRTTVELYCKKKSILNELKIQTALNQAGLAWTKESGYLTSEDCYMTTYTLEV